VGGKPRRPCPAFGTASLRLAAAPARGGGAAVVRGPHRLTPARTASNLLLGVAVAGQALWQKQPAAAGVPPSRLGAANTPAPGSPHAPLRPGHDATPPPWKASAGLAGSPEIRLISSGRAPWSARQRRVSRRLVGLKLQGAGDRPAMAIPVLLGGGRGGGTFTSGTGSPTLGESHPPWASVPAEGGKLGTNSGGDSRPAPTALVCEKGFLSAAVGDPALAAAMGNSQDSFPSSPKCAVTDAAICVVMRRSDRSALRLVDRRRDHGGLILGSAVIAVAPSDHGGSRAPPATWRNKRLQVVGRCSFGQKIAQTNGWPPFAVEVIASQLTSFSIAIQKKRCPSPFSVPRRRPTCREGKTAAAPRYLDCAASACRQTCWLPHSTIRPPDLLEASSSGETPIPHPLHSPRAARDNWYHRMFCGREWFALPQSTPTVQALLMVGGLERYYQWRALPRRRLPRRSPPSSPSSTSRSFLEQRGDP